MTVKRLLRFVRISYIFLLLVACQATPVPHATPSPVTEETTTPTRVQPSKVFPSPFQTQTPSSPILEKVNLADLNGIRLQFWHPYLDATNSQLQLLVNQFNRDNTWGIFVEMHSLGTTSELSRQIKMALPRVAAEQPTPEGSQLPDVVFANPDEALSWQAISPVLLHLDRYISDPIIGLSAQDLADFALPFWNRDRAGGEQMGIPALGSLQLLFYNVSWAEELGFNRPPTTPDEFRQQACQAALANRQDKTSANDGTGGWLVSTDPMTMIGWIAAFGGKVIAETGDQYTFSNPEIISAFTFLKNLISSNCAWSGLNPEPYDYFASHKTLFYSGSLVDINLQEAAMLRADNNDAWTVIPIPGISGQQVTIAFGPSYFIFGSSDLRQLAAWLFVRWMASPEQHAQIVQANGSYPLRISEMTFLTDYHRDNPQWAKALQLADSAQIPPNLASWGMISNVLEDASQQLFQPETTPDQIPGILTQMDEMAVELSRVSP